MSKKKKKNKNIFLNLTKTTRLANALAVNFFFVKLHYMGNFVNFEGILPWKWLFLALLWGKNETNEVVLTGLKSIVTLWSVVTLLVLW